MDKPKKLSKKEIELQDAIAKQLGYSGRDSHGVKMLREEHVEKASRERNTTRAIRRTAIVQAVELQLPPPYARLTDGANPAGKKRRPR